MKRILPVLLSAVLLGVSRLPLYSGWLAFVGLIPLLYYFEQDKRTPLTLLRDAFFFSAVNYTIWLHWIWGVTSGGFVGIILFYTLYFFAAFIVIQTIWQKLPQFRYAGFALVLLSVEYLQNFTEFRFAWINLGYALSDYTVLLQAADLGGVGLLSAFIILINICLYLALRGRKRYLVWIAVLMPVWIGYGVWCLQGIHLIKQDKHITVMQPSIPQEEKWETEHFQELFDRYAKLTRQAAQDSAKLIIWPEAAMPAYVLRDAVYLSMVQRQAEINRIDLFTGFPDVLPAPAGYPGGAYYYNAATLFHPDGGFDAPYYKMILVPVGERIPLLKVFPFLWKLQFGQANWEYGTIPKYYESSNLIFSPQICFEIAFPELNRQMAFHNVGTKQGSKPRKIDFLVNITNDAWFGRSSGPWIHAMMTKFRAIENRISIYRSANTGISMVVDPLGRVIKKTRLFEITNLQAPLYKTSRIPLYYYIYAWPRLILAAALALLLMALFRKKPSTLKKGGTS
jgi:apolipoprotein N-acyltransferase